jgi:acetyl/propionyl-CoA carboxylase alpha subunit
MTKLPGICKVLIANRSEVALRLQATYHAYGIETVAVFSAEDQSAPHVAHATQAFELAGQGSLAYRNAEEIIAIALAAGADAIAPGYGFLSENASFAQQVIDAGLVWVGPHPQAIAAMGDKVQARNLMQTVGVPVVPGIMIDDLDVAGKENARMAALKIGYPVILKDPKGGGGKAMRKIASSDDFDRAWDQVLAESKKLTGSATLLIEKYVINGRHIEIQIAGDGTRCIHLFERECSIQRRHQKIIEEAPCSFLPQTVLERMYQVAILAARAVGYDSIGTVEFIVTPDHDFYFLEMNTRLQVEHGVTELITGIDLVHLQLVLAATKQLPYEQGAVTMRGHAIQARVYAEDAAHNFTPSTGTLTHINLPQLPWARLEHALAVGTVVTPFFDPMIAKLLVWGPDRADATRRMQQLLQQTMIEGCITNVPFLLSIAQSLAFSSGAFHTQWLQDQAIVKSLCASECTEEQLLLSALAAALMTQQTLTTTSVLTTPEKTNRAWRLQQWQ